MAAIQRGFNKLLPFTDPTTPIWRDIIHSIVLCTFLYFAPQIPWQKIVTTLASKAQPEYAIANDERLEVDDEEQQQDDIFPDATIDVDVGVEQGEESGDEDELEDERQAPFNLDPAQAFGPDNGEGPVNAPDQPQARLRDPSRVVGAKKAKSLARRDRVRAYNEFLRQQGEAQRAQDAEGADEREAELRAERLRREKAEKRIEEAKLKERLRRKEQQGVERAREETDRQTVRRTVSSSFQEGRNAISVQTLAKEVKRSTDWVADLLKREGMLGTTRGNAGEKQTVLTMITQNGWLIRVDDKMMQQTYSRAVDQANSKTDDGKISWQNIGKMLVQELTAG